MDRQPGNTGHRTMEQRHEGLDRSETPPTGQVPSYSRALPATVMGLFAYVWATVLLGLGLLVKGILFPGRSGQPLAVWWARTMAWNMGMTVSLVGKEKIAPGTAYIMTANHQSYIDHVPLLVALPIPFRWFLKEDLLRIPVFGWCLKRLGAIPVNRGDKEKAARSIDRTAQVLAGGDSVLIYPEGTHTADGYLQNFKKGAFVLALQTGAPILPVTCNGAFKVLPRGRKFILPGHVTVTLGNPIITQGLTASDLDALMERTRMEMESNLDPNYDPFARNLS